MAEDTTTEKKSGGGSGSPMKLVIVMIVGAVLLVAVSIGGVFFMMKSMGMLGGGGGSAGNVNIPAKNDPAIYFPLEPAFVVNFKERGRTRFLQVSIEVMTRDPMVIEDIKTHMPLIRNNILLLLGSQKAEDLHTTEGKEIIRQAALEELKRLLGEETGRINVEGLYFTSFVTQ